MDQILRDDVGNKEAAGLCYVKKGWRPCNLNLQDLIFSRFRVAIQARCCRMPVVVVVGGISEEVSSSKEGSRETRGYWHSSSAVRHREGRVFGSTVGWRGIEKATEQRGSNFIMIPS